MPFSTRDLSSLRYLADMNDRDNSIRLANVVRSISGVFVSARIAYPEVLHVEIKDSAGELWRLVTQDAEWSPSDPAELIGRSIAEIDMDTETGDLRCNLSDGSAFNVRPATREAEDDPPNWELTTPSGVVVEFGPTLAVLSEAGPS
jgi:hypothetical protein